MSDGHDPDRPNWVEIGPVTVKGEAPWFAPWVYVVPAVGSALWVALVGPYDGWWAALAAVVAATFVYVAVTVVVFVTGLTLGVISGWRRHREYKRDPRAFFEKRFRRRRPPDSPPTGPLGPEG